MTVYLSCKTKVVSMFTKDVSWRLGALSYNSSSSLLLSKFSSCECALQAGQVWIQVCGYWMSWVTACLHLQLEENNTWLPFNSIPSSLSADSTAQHKNYHVHLTSALLMLEFMLVFNATHVYSTVCIQRVSHQGEGLISLSYLQAACNFRSASWISKCLNVGCHHVYLF